MVVARRSRQRLPFSGWHLLLMPTALVFVLPLVWMILTSFMPDGDINTFPPKFFPSRISLAGYSGLFTDSDILRWLAKRLPQPQRRACRRNGAEYSREGGRTHGRSAS